jgi:hypothetical protein
LLFNLSNPARPGQGFSPNNFKNLKTGIMTHRQNAIAYCKDYLEQRTLAHLFTEKQFDEFYKDSNARLKNTYAAGLEAADFFISGQR